MDRIMELLRYALHYSDALHDAMAEMGDEFTPGQIEAIGEIVEQLTEFRNEIE